jgi:hypothetical protein
MYCSFNDAVGSSDYIVSNDRTINKLLMGKGPPLWFSGQSSSLHIQRSRVRFPALPDFMSSSGSGTGSTQPRDDN